MRSSSLTMMLAFNQTEDSMAKYFLKVVIPIEAKSWYEAMSIMEQRLEESGGLIKVDGIETKIQHEAVEL